MIASYLLILLVVSVSGLYVVSHMASLENIIHSLNAVDVKTARLAKEIAQSFYDQVGFEKKYLISGDQDFLRQYEKVGDYIVSKIGELEKISEGSTIHAPVAVLGVAYQSYQAGVHEMGTDPPDQASLGKKETAVAEIEKAIRQIAELSDQARIVKLQASEQVTARITRAISITESVAVVLMILIAFLITRSIKRPIDLLSEKTKVIAAGDFGTPLDIVSPPEIRDLAESFNVMCSRLEELDRMKLDFIGHLSHELRTPLTAIKEASCMLMEGVYANRPDRQKELFDIVNGECERLIASVTRILDLSRMEAGMAAFYFDILDISPIIKEKVAKLQPIAGRKGIDLLIEPPFDLPSIRIDGDKIGQVIENILGNALKFTPKGGRVVAAARENRVDHTVEVSVVDTGCGIAEEHLQEIFDKFKRVDDRKGAVRGTGLGLSIAKHIVNAHGGAIWAESERGTGSTFVFSLPMSPSS